jgi:protein TonB
MKPTNANRISPGYELKDELARYCLPGSNRDPNRKLAWVNSICILFLLIGVLGAKPASVAIRPVPVVEEAIPTIIEPLPLPPQTVAPNENPDETEEQRSEAPQVVVVTPDAPNINFAVPTIGNLLAPSAMAQAPPLKPLQQVAPVSQLARLSNTGTGGERPQPTYPKIALEQAEQGTVVLQMTADAAGTITSIQVKESSGFPVLDHGAMDFVKRHWTLPAGTTNQLFETSITYKIQTD